MLKNRQSQRQSLFVFGFALSPFLCHSTFSSLRLLRDAHRLRSLPGVIVNGRYDVVCPLENAWALHREWPEADFIITPDAGHLAFEPANSRALVAATDRFAERG